MRPTGVNTPGRYSSVFHKGFLTPDSLSIPTKYADRRFGSSGKKVDKSVGQGRLYFGLSMAQYVPDATPLLTGFAMASYLP